VQASSRVKLTEPSSAGSYLDLKIDRRGADDEPNLFSVKIKRSELVALNEHAQSKASAPLVTAPRPAPAR
jgi:hypothetical protein